MKRLALLLLAFTLTACQTATNSPPPTPVQLDGMYGGVLSYVGIDFLVVAMDIATTSGGSVSGYGVGTADGDSFGYMSVTGTTQPNGDVRLTLTDLAGDWIILDGTFNGTRFEGGWRTNVATYTGTFRITHEDDIDTLSHLSVQSNASIRDFF